MIIKDRLSVVKITIILLVVFDISNEGESYCISPPIPENGIYKLGSILGKPGNKIVDGMSLNYECETNYHPMPTDLIFCDDGTWSDTVLCFKSCNKIESSTTTFQCNHHGKSISCANPAMNETEVTFKCKERHIAPNGHKLNTLRCINGKWNNPTPFCVTECGKQKPKEARPLSINSYFEIRGNSPWHVAIYKYKVSYFENICGGTILTNKIVISAAHCFSEDGTGTISPKEQFAIGVGKYYKSWNHPDDDIYEHVQKLYVQEILTTGRYGGPLHSFQDDIALLILKTTIDFYDSVNPICYDLFSLAFNNKQLANGTLGKVVGWGVTEEGAINTASDVLKAITIPVINYRQCHNTISTSLRRYLLSDKFCAGWLNGTNVCNGDSGGALVIASTDKGVERWFIRGLVSLSDSDKTGLTCRKGTYTLFTNVFRHKDFILETINKYK